MQEMVRVRKDWCRINDLLEKKEIKSNCKVYR
jgi:hypothetical protein